ncbi:TIGR03086 family metal-binding protein [Streptomyces sp. NPDC090032]|uniref:TIGR03086 family metal-binding protein n=1 Tax=unclassified Streptomyces TaxID=2593676 RepID=UPI0037204BCF
MPTNRDLVALDAEAVRTSVDMVARATAGDLDRPTPCAGWTLRDLLGHMAAQHYGFAAASRGEADIAVWRPRPLGDDPVGAYREAARHVLEAFAVDGVAQRAFPLPEIRDGGPFPGAQAVSFHFIDYVVHSWDVARTLGHPVAFDPELLDVALAVARAVPGGEARRGPGAAFAPAVTSQGGARLDEIVALLGRSPAWRPVSV